MKEQDPTGRKPTDAGAKLDAGKVRPALVLGGFARALLEVSKVGTFGASKYTENGWIEVPNGEARYEDADLRHWLKSKTGEEVDPDSNLDHLAHKAWNALAVLDLALRRKEQEATDVKVVEPGWYCALTTSPTKDGVYKVRTGGRHINYSKYENGQWCLTSGTAEGARLGNQKSLSMYTHTDTPEWLQE